MNDTLDAPMHVIKTIANYQHLLDDLKKRLEWGESVTVTARLIADNVLVYSFLE